MIHAVKVITPVSRLPVIGAKFEGPCEFLDTRAGVYRATLQAPDPAMQAVQTALIGAGHPEHHPMPLHAAVGWVGVLAALLMTAALGVQMLRQPAPAKNDCIPGAGWAQCSGVFNRASVSL